MISHSYQDNKKSATHKNVFSSSTDKKQYLLVQNYQIYMSTSIFYMFDMNQVYTGMYWLQKIALCHMQKITWLLCDPV